MVLLQLCCCPCFRRNPRREMSKKFAKDCLDEHNACRKKHGSHKLELDSDLCRLAQRWADRLAEKGALEHSRETYKGERLGENVAGKWSSGVADYTGEEVTQHWYSEVEKYDYKAKTPNMEAGHFTQVIWKDSKKLGVGKAAKNGKCYVVANYLPAGNFVGDFQANVPPPDLSSKVKSLLKISGGKKHTKDSSSSDSEDEKKGKKFAVYKGDGGQVRKVTQTKKTIITKRVTRPDGTVEETQEEIIEEGPGTEESLKKLSLGTKKVGTGSGSKPEKRKKLRSMDQFRNEALAAHNDHRKKHGSPPIKLSSSLSKYAQDWAEKLVASGNLAHSDCTLNGDRLGENIAYKWSSDPTADYAGEEFVKQWYDEEPKYDYSGSSNMGAAGHFTQVIWKGSKELGIGRASDSSGKTFVVASYKPAGNMMGQFADNVGRPK